MAWDNMTRHKHAGGLGFRNLRDFNLAMLGKQCWRLITNADSLVARVYKAKYYADKDFLQSSIGNSPSFIWRSLIKVRKVILEGSHWRIGTGTEVMIMAHPWLSSKDNPYIVTSSPSLVNQSVSSLLCTGTKEWDLDINTDIFEARDQHCILNTRIERELDKDILSWKLEHSGQYSVKSAYKLLQSQKGAWIQDENNGFW